MMVESDRLGRIKVTLTYEDSLGLGICFKTIDCKKLQTRIILRALFKAAAKELGQDETTERLLIEAYPYLNGGGVLYFTQLAGNHKKQLRLKEKNEVYAYDFSDGGNLLSALQKLYGELEDKSIKSKIYDIDGVFRLIIDKTNLKNDLVLLEFCDDFTAYERVKKYTCEHGRVLTGDNAIYEIGTLLQSL